MVVIALGALLGLVALAGSQGDRIGCCDGSGAPARCPSGLGPSAALAAAQSEGPSGPDPSEICHEPCSQPFPSPTLGAPRGRATSVAVVAIVLVAVLASVRFLPQPMATHDLTVVNPHHVGRPCRGRRRRGASIAVGAVPREHTRTFTEVPEPGNPVTIRFRYQQVTAELQLGRDQLAASGGKVEVPESFGLQLSELGVPPTPVVP